MRRLVICSRTREYRRAARELLPLKSRGWVLEVGCHEGITTQLLAEGAQGRVLGIDRSHSAIEAARRRDPGLHFEVLDASLQGALSERIPALLAAAGAGSSEPAACFVDLGGDARLSAVLHVLAELRGFGRLELTVVKNEEQSSGASAPAAAQPPGALTRIARRPRSTALPS
eukprot:TRINITY_DN85281_c0_g1_i1.p1 TRINITY_DN85281_c0_g1~~TRINITY_DN85281_c0_g1_i1.p1  ORF type:complete len:188 (-),score=36.74 TRINITY_DN85281_c0_g1_i1:106-621(-)